MSDHDVKVEFDPPELKKQLPPELVEDIKQEERSDSRFQTMLWTSLGLLFLKLGIDPVSATAGTVVGYGAMATGGAAVVLGTKNLINAIRNKKKEYVHRGP